MNAEPKTPPPPQAEQIPYEILRALRKIVRRISEHSKYLSRTVGLTVPQLMCMKAIAELPGEEITVAMVSQQIHLTAATVSRIVDRLEKAGLVLRERRAKDRRKVCLSLSEEGHKRYQNLPTPLQEQFLQNLQECSLQEQMQMLQLLQQITEMMEASNLDASPLLTPDIN